MNETRRKCERIIGSLGDVHEYFIEEAQPGSRQARESIAARWIPLAACFTLAAMVVLFFIVNGIGTGIHGNVPGGTLAMATDDDGMTTPEETTEHVPETDLDDTDIIEVFTSRLHDTTALTLAVSSSEKQLFAYNEHRAYYFDLYNDELFDLVGDEYDDAEVEVWDADYGPVYIITIKTPAGGAGDGVSVLRDVYAYDWQTGAFERGSVDPNDIVYTRCVDYDGGLRIYWIERDGEIIDAGKVLELVGQSSRNTTVGDIIGETREIVINYIDQGGSDFVICSVDTGEIRDVLSPLREQGLVGEMGTSVLFNARSGKAVIENEITSMVYIYDTVSESLMCVTDIEELAVSGDDVRYSVYLKKGVAIMRAYVYDGDVPVTLSVSLYEMSSGICRRVLDRVPTYYRGDEPISPLPAEGAWTGYIFDFGKFVHYTKDGTYLYDVLTGETTKLPEVNEENAEMSSDELLEPIKDRLDGDWHWSSFSYDYNKLVFGAGTKVYYYDTVSGALIDIEELPEVKETYCEDHESIYCHGGFNYGSNDVVTVEVMAKSDKYLNVKHRRTLLYRVDGDHLTFIGEGEE